MLALTTDSRRRVQYLVATNGDMRIPPPKNKSRPRSYSANIPCENMPTTIWIEWLGSELVGQVSLSPLVTNLGRRH